MARLCEFSSEEMSFDEVEVGKAAEEREK